MSPQERTAAAFILFILAGYLLLLGMSRAGDWDGESEARWSLRGAGALALAAVGMLVWAAQW